MSSINNTKRNIVMFSLVIFLLVNSGVVFAQSNQDRYRDYERHWQDSEGESGLDGQDEEQIRYWRRGYSSEMTNNINALSSESVATFPIPVAFGVEVSDLYPNFGDPRDGGARLHEGFDMLAPDGTPIVSPTEAVVLRTGEGSSSGKNVYTANPGGETFVYMHLADVADISPGDVLAKGDLIGYVGDTGNAIGGPAHLHFEVRKNGATDPYPRLDQVFTLQERIEIAEKALLEQNDPDSYARFLVAEFREVFENAQAEGIILPSYIVSALESVGANVAVSAAGLPSGDLTIDSTGSEVVSLQEFLIGYGSGDAIERLARAGATGYFGPITEAALAEFQALVGISPAVGYYGPVTRSYIENSVAGTTLAEAEDNQESVSENGIISGEAQEVQEQDTPATLTDVSDSFSRDLSYGSVGEDVRALQVFLNEQNFEVAGSGPGSPGEETDYFGPATRAALVAFQLAHDITPSVGYFGPITRSTVGTYF